VLYINLNFDEIFKIKKMFYLKNYQISNHNSILKLGTKIVDGGFLDPRTFIFNIKQGDVYAIKFD